MGIINIFKKRKAEKNMKSTIYNKERFTERTPYGMVMLKANTYDNAVRKLAYYEDAEELGLIVVKETLEEDDLNERK